jgi:hypothetical protein
LGKPTSFFQVQPSLRLPSSLLGVVFSSHLASIHTSCVHVSNGVKLTGVYPCSLGFLGFGSTLGPAYVLIPTLGAAGVTGFLTTFLLHSPGNALLLEKVIFMK